MSDCGHPNHGKRGMNCGCIPSTAVSLLPPEPMRVPVLDHGYVMLIASMGSDQSIIEAARMSTDGAFRGWGTRWQCTICRQLKTESDVCPNDIGDGTHMGAHTTRLDGDEKLLAYLWRNGHTTPFEMGEIALEVQAPIMVLRQWFTHRTQSRNEHSARYGPLPPLDYLPPLERLMPVPTTNKQARGATSRVPTGGEVEMWRDRLRHAYALVEEVYQEGLTLGIPTELARLPLTVGRYSRMRVKANLWNWLRFLTLRTDDHAQWEIRQYAHAIADIVKLLFPRTHELWKGGRA